MNKSQSITINLALRMALLWTFLQTDEACGQFYCIPTRFAESPVPPAPNYAQERYWAALPGRKDRADRTPPGCRDGQERAGVDVFYIHPTLYSSKPQTAYRWNQNLDEKSHNREIDRLPMHFQASAFNGAGKVYAPRYRQAHYSVFLTSHLDDKEAALGIAYSDIEAAFTYFLEYYNQGRPFILAGHSQGTLHAARLLKHKIIGTPLQDRLVVAYLPGMAIPADSLADLPVCVDSTATGCYVSWSTYLRGYTPPSYSKGLHLAACVNPVSWIYVPTTGSRLRLPLDSASGLAAGPYSPKNHHRGAVLRPFWKKYPGICDAQVQGGMLWVTRPRFWGNFLYQSPNYHTGDINLFYMDIRANAIRRVLSFEQNSRNR